MNRNSGLQSLLSGIRRVAARVGLPALLSSAAVCGATFGTVVPLDLSNGGHVSDLVLDEPRGVLYAANFTARRIEVISLTDQKVVRKIDVPAEPAAMAMSPDGSALVVTHFSGDPGFVLNQAPAGGCPSGAVSVINLGSGAITLTACAKSPLAVGFGNDGLALIATVNELLLLDPVSGASQSLGELRCGNTLNGVAAAVCVLVTGLAVPLNNFPAQILAASITAAQDGFTLFGQLKVTQNITAPSIGPTAVLRFRYDVRQKNVVWLPSGSNPGSGPSTVSVNGTGSRFMAGWSLFDRNGSVVAQFHNPTTTDNIGSHAFDFVGNASYPYGVIYAQVPDGSGPGSCPFTDSYCPGPVTPPSSPVASPSTPEPVLMLVDADNLTVHERIRLPENLAGRSVLNAKRDVMYSASDSGVLILPVGTLPSQPRLATSKEDVVFRPDPCQSGIAAQTFDIVNPGGGKVGFVIVPTDGGIHVSPRSGFTPTRVTVTVDPGSFQQQNGTVTAALEIFSLDSVNVPSPVRVLVNNRGADQRGTFVNVPGTLVDLLADPARDRYYVLRQQKNDVLVYDSKSNNLLAAMRTSATPTQMTLTMDGKYLLVGHEDSQFAYVYDLDAMAPVPDGLHIVFPLGHYPKSIAAANGSILAASRTDHVLGPNAVSSPAQGQSILIDAVDFANRIGWTLPTLGIYGNCVSTAGPCPYNTILTPSADGRVILAALSDGNVFLYSDALHTFTSSRKDFASLFGAYAASNNGLYVVGNNLLNSSLVRVKSLDTGVNPSSGFVFVNNGAFRTTAALAPPVPPDTTETQCVFGGTICVTVRLPGNGVATYPLGAITPGSLQAVTNLGPDKFDPSLSDTVRPVRLPESPVQATTAAVFTRTLAAVRDQSELVLLTLSGLTIEPWNYDAPLPIPQLQRVVSAADQTKSVAAGGLISVMGLGMPTVLGDACLTVNGASAPLLHSVSSTQVNAQLPFDASGNAQLTLYTPGGSSDNLNITILPAAPSVFRVSADLAAAGAGAMVYRASNNSVVSPSNPVQADDELIIYATGLGQTAPAIRAGEAAPSDPLSSAVIQPDVSLDGLPMAVDYAGLTPGGIGIYQINVRAPLEVSDGQNVPLTIRQGGMSTTVSVQVAAQ